jgi:outer membrane lipoprotein-sorting protein
VGVLLGICAVIALGSTLAVAATSGGPEPVAKNLAPAIHDALAAPPVDGLSADITFKNSLIDSSELQGTDPLLSGGSGRLWLSNDHRFRLELQSDGGRPDAQVVVNRTSWWVYDPGSNTVYRGTLPARAGRGSAAKRRDSHDAIPTVAKIQQELNRLMAHLSVTGPIPGNVAHQPAYTVRVTPKDSGGLIGAAELAWDAVRGVPLRVAVYSRSDAANPVLELGASNIQYGPQDASVFDVAAPTDAKVVKVATARTVGGHAASHAHKQHRHGASEHRHEVSGPTAVARHLPFALDAPGSLAGLSRSSVKLLDMSGHPGALVLYGHGLGSVVVVEQAAGRKPAGAPNPSSSSDRGEGPGLSLPTVDINGTSAQELDTALGTVVRFTRGGVSYIVAGSVSKTVAEATARGL